MTIEKECKAPNCTNEASKLRCPDCAKYPINSLFCSQDCFKKCWKQHKTFHQIFNNCQRMLQAMTQEERDNLENDFKGGNIFAGIYYTGSRNAEGLKHGTFYWLSMKGNFLTISKMVGVNTSGSMGIYLRVSIKMIKCTAMGNTVGQMVVSIKEPGRRIRCTAMDLDLGLMVLIMKENIVTDYATEKERWSIQMEKYLMAFVNDEKKEGQYTFITGDVFIGPFRNDRPEGNGKLIKSNGETILGHFRNGVFTRGEKKKASSDELCISDLEVGRTHTGQVLSGIIISKPMKLNALHFTLQDSEKAEMTVSVYNYPGYQDTRGMIVNKKSLLNFDTCGLEEGKKIRIRNPYCKVAMDGQILIRVDDYSTIQFMN